jgi:hypothetical protein
MNRIVVIVSVALATGCLDISLPERPPPPGSGAVQGTVVHAEPGQSVLRPATGATIELVGSGVRTQATGETAAFNLTPVDTATGNVLIRFDQNGDGQPDKQKLLRLEGLGAGRGKLVTLGQVVLGSNGSIRGRVLRGDTASSSGHGGTSVFIPEGPFFGFTGDDGTFLLENLPEGRLSIAIFRAGYVAAAETVELRAGELFPLRTITLQPDPGNARATVRGRVLLPDGAAAPDVTVSLSSGRTATTDADGRFAFADVPYEVYSVGFVKAGFLTAELLNIIVASPTVTLRDVTLAPGPSTTPQLDAGRPSFDAGTPDAGAMGGGGAGGGAAGGSAGGSAAGGSAAGGSAAGGSAGGSAAGGSAAGGSAAGGSAAGGSAAGGSAAGGSAAGGSAAGGSAAGGSAAGGSAAGGSAAGGSAAGGSAAGGSAAGGSAAGGSAAGGAAAGGAAAGGSAAGGSAAGGSAAGGSAAGGSAAGGSAAGGSAAGGAGGGSSTDAGLDAGVADAGIDAGPPPVAIIDAPPYVSPNALFTISAQRSTGERPLIYTWSQDAGPAITIPNNGTQLAATPMVRAPVSPTLLKFNLTVTEPSGRASAPSSVLIPVAVPPNAVITGAPASVVGGQRVYLSGATSTDPNGTGIVDWEWTVVPSSIGIVVTPLAGGLLQLDMPAPVTTPLVVTVRLVVTNGLGLRSGLASVSFTLGTGTLPQWSVDAGTPQTVNGGSVVTLVGSVFSPQPDGGFTYQWTPDREPDAGVADWVLSDPTSPITQFIAPRVDGPVPRLITFTLTATDTTGTLTPSQRSSSTTVNVIDRRPPQVVATSVTTGRNGLWSAFVDFDEPISSAPFALNNVDVTVVGAGPPTNTVGRIVDGNRLWLALRPPLTPGYQYTLRIAGVQDLAIPTPNQMPTAVTQTFLATNRWSPAWETTATSATDMLPAVMIPKPAPGQPPLVYLAGRRDGLTWAAQPFDPLSCTTPPCTIADDVSAPSLPVTGPAPRGHRGQVWGSTPVATLQVADFQGTSPVVLWRNPTWQPLPAAPPGTVFPGPRGLLYSPHVDDGGLKLAAFDGGTWAPFATVSADTVEYSVGPTADPLGIGWALPGSTNMYVLGRSSSGVNVRQFFYNGASFNAGNPTGGGSGFTDMRMTTDLAGGGGGPTFLRQGGIYFYCSVSCSAGPYTYYTTGVTSFDTVGNYSNDLLVAAVNGQLMLHTTANGFPLQPGPLRGGMPSTVLNNDPSCIADRPEVGVVDTRFVVAWQERCGTGPWKVYLRMAE